MEDGAGGVTHRPPGIVLDAPLARRLVHENGRSLVDREGSGPRHEAGRPGIVRKGPMEGRFLHGKGRLALDRRLVRFA